MSFLELWWFIGHHSFTKKALYFEKEYNNDFEVAFFLETHHKAEKEIPAEILRYQNTHHIIHSPAPRGETYAGIIGLVSAEYDIIDKKEVIPGRILNVKMQNKRDKTNRNITAVYLYTNNNFNREKIENIVKKLRNENQDHPNNIIVGDFNFTDNEKDKIKGLNNTDKLICKTWYPFLAEMDLVDPYREQNPKRRIWSFLGTRKAGNSRIVRLCKQNNHQ